MGLANAQRTLNYIRIFTEFFSQPEYVNVIPMFGILNEAFAAKIGKDTLSSLCVVVPTFASDSVDAHLLAIWKPIGSSAKSLASAKVKAHGS